jgi:hypothetical protein
MEIRITRLRITAVALALCGLAATAAVAGTAGSASASPTTSMTAASKVPVLIDCLRHGDVRPGGYVFTCADANSYLTGLHWATWTGRDAFATGTYAFNDCTPSCVQGHLHSFPALVLVWRPESWPGHHGGQYFSRMTTVLDGNRTYTAGGHVHTLPVTTTLTLSTSGG